MTLAALLLLGIAAAILASLGRWQLHRADERRAVLAAIEGGRALAPLALAPDTPAPQLTAWRAASAEGQWLPQFSVLLENRNHGGRPGYWLATPLRLHAGGAAVLVLRGWLPRALGAGQTLSVPAPPAGPQAVTGELMPRVPRLFELWSFGDARAGKLPDTLPASGALPPVVQNLQLDDYARASGLTLLPTVLMQTGEHNDGLARDWPQPSVDYNQNIGYAMQWFAFAGIAAIAWLVVAARAWRRRRQA
ncbi:MULTISPECIES: SURF1 family protein [Bordetella]|uniref:SURF1 family protein n=1 Tax=Bordetella TaxID=517 RepID=UPI00036015A6|nr:MULTISPECIES: SURF1 family protein [Bordetella]ALX26627.1 membrane protein [Bordetella pertussis]AMS53060.1 membrane protein [Bordetella pertussis]AMS60264.1 membrane protein [Bordetella pertussis]AMS63845.1 membrane protein [Bordetella pertussis]AMS67461.1 membrane protein [Bordetella pertussis]